MKTRVTIVGGGLSGLFTASELLAAGIDDIVLLDRDSEPGGVTRTIRRDGYELEPAATTLLLPNPHLTEVLDHLGAEVAPAIDGATRYLYTRGRLITLPSSPKAMLAPVVPWSAKLRAVVEPLVRTRASSPDESLEDFMRRRLGQDSERRWRGWRHRVSLQATRNACRPERRFRRSLPWRTPPVRSFEAVCSGSRVGHRDRFGPPLIFRSVG